MFVTPPQDLAPYALRIEVPSMETAAPPPVSMTGGAGSEPMKFASGDHTHASKVRSQRITMPSAAATYVWTYPVAYGSGVVPTCSGVAQVASGSTDLINVQIVGAPTNTQCTFQINRASPGLLALLLGALSLNSTPLAYTLHLFALES